MGLDWLGATLLKDQGRGSDQTVVVSLFFSISEALALCLSIPCIYSFKTFSVKCSNSNSAI